jgi:hypothetical protein
MGSRDFHQEVKCRYMDTGSSPLAARVIDI